MNSTVFLSILTFSSYIFILVIISLKFIQKTRASELKHSNELTLAKKPAKIPELELRIILDERSKVGYAETIVKNFADDDIYNYAFYLVVDGDRKSVRWHEASPKFEFQIPDTGTKREIIAFVKDGGDQIASIRKDF